MSLHTEASVSRTPARHRAMLWLRSPPAASRPAPPRRRGTEPSRPLPRGAPGPALCCRRLPAGPRRTRRAEQPPRTSRMGRDHPAGRRSGAPWAPLSPRDPQTTGRNSPSWRWVGRGGLPGPLVRPWGCPFVAETLVWGPWGSWPPLGMGALPSGPSLPRGTGCGFRVPLCFCGGPWARWAGGAGVPGLPGAGH